MRYYHTEKEDKKFKKKIKRKIDNVKTSSKKGDTEVFHSGLKEKVLLFCFDSYEFFSSNMSEYYTANLNNPILFNFFVTSYTGSAA